MTTTTPAREESPGCRFWSSEYDRGAVSERFPGTTSTPSASASSVRSRRRQRALPRYDRGAVGNPSQTPTVREGGATARHQRGTLATLRGRRSDEAFRTTSGSVVGLFPALTGWGLARVTDGVEVVPGKRSPTAPRSYWGGARRRRRGRTGEALADGVAVVPTVTLEPAAARRFPTPLCPSTGSARRRPRTPAARARTTTSRLRCWRQTGATALPFSMSVNDSPATNDVICATMRLTFTGADLAAGQKDLRCGDGNTVLFALRPCDGAVAAQVGRERRERPTTPTPARPRPS